MPNPVAWEQATSVVAIRHLHGGVAAQLALGVDMHREVPGGWALAVALDRAECLPVQEDVVVDVSPHDDLFVQHAVLVLQPLALGFTKLLPGRVVVPHHGCVQALVLQPAEAVTIGVVLAIAAVVQLQVQGAHVEGEVDDGPLAFAEIRTDCLPDAHSGCPSIHAVVCDRADAFEPRRQVLEVAKAIDAWVGFLPGGDVPAPVDHPGLTAVLPLLLLHRPLWQREGLPQRNEEAEVGQEHAARSPDHSPRLKAEGQAHTAGVGEPRGCSGQT
mmetsp:Transcript_40652/g.81913  ORF Transcript_40652/g.81913 Transcript_40652/m.81913 type:complete len:272 (+) Transcript_40652:415-1230(+)